MGWGGECRDAGGVEVEVRVEGRRVLLCARLLFEIFSLAGTTRTNLIKRYPPSAFPTDMQENVLPKQVHVECFLLWCEVEPGVL